MEHARVFKQPFRKSITFKSIFQTALCIFIASWLGDKLFRIMLNFNMKLIDSFWGSILLILLFVLFLILVCGSLNLIISNNYVIVYNDRLVCQNRFIPFLTRTFHFARFKDYPIGIYVPWLNNTFNMICFFEPGKKYWINNNGKLIAISEQDCFELADILRKKGFNVKIYNERLFKKKKNR